MMWLLVLMLVAASYGDQEKPFKGDKVIRVTTKVSFWKEAMKPGMDADIHVPAKFYSKLVKYLHSNGIQFVIQIFDVQTEVEMEEVNLGRAGGFFSNYQRLDAIERAR